MTHTEELLLVAELHERATRAIQRLGKPFPGWELGVSLDKFSMVMSDRGLVVIYVSNEGEGGDVVYEWERASVSSSHYRHTRKIRYNVNLIRPALETLCQHMVLQDLADV